MKTIIKTFYLFMELSKIISFLIAFKTLKSFTRLECLQFVDLENGIDKGI
jgi:hypothetical protein